MKRLIFIILFLIPGVLFSINKKKWKQTKSGVYYKVFTNDTAKAKPVYGDHIWMHLKKFSPKNKEIFNTKIFDTRNGVEMDFKKPEKPGDVIAIFSMMGKGDSALVKVPENLLDSNGNKKRFYTFRLSLVDFKTRIVYQDEIAKHYKQQIALDSLAIDDYIKSNDLNQCRQDEHGNWFLVKQHGTEKLIKDSSSVQIHYKGKLLNGLEFDNSFDRNQTLSFIVGKKQVIEGLDKGIQNFYIGDKGILIIPSRLAYGDKEVGKIPPNSVLIFEIEIQE